jgi:hypothetical protein
MFMNQSSHSPAPAIRKLITLAIWVAAFALLLARKWLIGVFGLNTTWYGASFMGPAWAFFLVVCLAVFLRMFRQPAEKWSQRARVIFALVAAFVLALPQYDLILTVRGGWSFQIAVNRLWLILPLVTGVVFTLLPASVIVAAWLGHNRLLSTLRALGLALVVHGLVYVPFGLWVNTLIKEIPIYQSLGR